MPSLDEPGLAPSAVCELLRECSPTSILAGAIGADSALVRERLNLYLTRWRHVRTALDGADLLKMGVPSGRRLGLTLKALQDARLDGKIDSREDEIELVQRWLSAGEMKWNKCAVSAARPWTRRTYRGAGSAAGPFTWPGPPGPTSRNAAPTSFTRRAAA